MADTHTPPNFDARLFALVKANKNSVENFRLLDAWRRAEGGTAKWNPLNTQLKLGAAYDEGQYNSIGVMNYKYEIAGICAAALTLITRERDGTMRYHGILSDLQVGEKTAEQMVDDNADEFAHWGTSTSLMLAVLAES